jgi:hypothetical protein
VATIIISSADALPGGEASIEVVLQSDTLIDGTANEIEFRPEAAIAANSTGRPLCVVNPDINKDSSSFAFTPLDCTVGVDCTGIKAVIFSLGPVDPIPSGSVLYACTVAVAAAATPGDYPLTCANAQAVDPNGTPVATACIDGLVTVVAFASPTPTATPVPPPTPTRTRNVTPHVEDDGCQLVAPVHGSAAWLLVVPALLLRRWRRRR